MRKRLETMMAVAFCLAIIIGPGCGQRPADQQEAPDEAQVLGKQARADRLWTDDDFVEFLAQSTYLSEMAANDPVRYMAELENVYKKLGLEEGKVDEWNAQYMKWMEDWQNRIITDPEGAGKDWERIMKQVDARVAELRRGR